MSMSSSQKLKLHWPYKAIIAHYLSDEAYVTEYKNDKTDARIITRMSLYLFWAISSSAGCIFAIFIPHSISALISNLTFPVSAMLFALSMNNIINYINTIKITAIHNYTRIIISILLCIILAVILIKLLGEKYFWLPSIFICYLILKKSSKTL